MQQINNMAQQDKTDFYWNGVLSGAVNNLYYDLINVDVCHVPYATNHRNSSFFLKTRPGFHPEVNWKAAINVLKENRDVTDVHIVRDEKCNQENWRLYVMARQKDGKQYKRRIFTSLIENGCVWSFADFIAHHTRETTVSWCGDWKFLVTDYAKWWEVSSSEAKKEIEWQVAPGHQDGRTGIQINNYTWWTTIGQFQDVDTRDGYMAWDTDKIHAWMYLVVYSSSNKEWSWFAGQVRMITWFEWWKTINVDSPWLWFKAPTAADFTDGEERILTGWDLQYAFFEDWWEVVWFTDGNKIQLICNPEENKIITPYAHEWTEASAASNIIALANANDKVFVLTDNGYIHYNKDSWWYNKFFINDDMFAGVDKISLVAFRDMILAFWRRHIALWVPDEQNKFWTMYNQSTTIGLWSRYSFAEYDWELVFVSNDKRLLSLWVSNASRYWLSFEDRPWFDRLNWRLSTLVETDEVYIWNDDNYLRVFINTKSKSYRATSSWWVLPMEGNNTLTRIHKFNKLFQVWTEDYIPHFLLWWCKFWVFFWQYWLYIRWWTAWYDADGDGTISPEDREDIDDDRTYYDYSCNYNWNESLNRRDVEVDISAFLIENESNWLDNHPLLFQLAKLNRLITTLWPWAYSDGTYIKLTTYSKWIWIVYKFPIWTAWTDYNNLRVDLITKAYLWLDIEEDENLACIKESIVDSGKDYIEEVTCPSENMRIQYYVPESPWCSSNREYLFDKYKLCINDTLFRLAPTMPLVTSLWENQTYSTQIKIELIWGKWDIITFGWWLAELYLAPLWLTWPDWEYQLQPQTDC